MACALDNAIKEEALKVLRSLLFSNYPILCGRRSSEYLLANMNWSRRARTCSRAGADTVVALTVPTDTLSPLVT